MIRTALIVLVLALAAPALAEPVAVRSGEHEGFTRLVFPLPSGMGWGLDHADGVYTLRPDGPVDGYDLSAVFRLIPRTRVTEVAALPGKSDVSISVAEGVEATAFETAGGAVVIDFREAPEPQIALSPRPALPSYSERFRAFEAPGRSELPERALALPQPDRRIRAAEEDLLRQIGRAASQGLIHVDPAAMRLPEIPVAPPQPPAEIGDHLALHSETAFDRAGVGPSDQPMVSDYGETCLPDRMFDAAAWLDDRPPAEQIAAARNGLLGEFDKPQPDQVVALARVYVALGFGAEARLLLRSLAAPSDTTRALEFMAAVVEDLPRPDAKAILTMGKCNGKVALWALLGARGTPSRWDYDLGAVLRANAALPPGLRTVIARRLADRLIALGAEDAAQAVWKALERAPAEVSAPLGLIGAQLGEMPESKLVELMRSNQESAVDALIQFVEGRFARGEPIDDGTISQAEALAVELLPSAKGVAVLRAQILGLGSVGRFDPAFAALAGWPDATDETLRVTTTADLIGQLSDVPDDALFLRAFYAQRAVIEAGELPKGTRLQLAERLLNQGFAPAARTSLAALGQSEAGRLLLARAALLEGDGPATLAHLGALDSAQAAGLRAQAAALMGQYALARNAFMQAGDTDGARAAAWRSADWDAVAQEGTEAQRQLLALYSDTPSAEDGPLAASRALLARSRAERAAFAALMESFSAPQVQP
ncbi:hypothetical protein OE699_13100 [Sedimentimonas flavescens]|uniref:HEAT repeat protein n=1 Tax=Sedimentimonas flavescens TaxID=2851012 RepID=A0ABT3A1Q6_9RHOB|nr:hypothetical protein [Sedimentimonas flavescens]MCV2879782.1 hypothetical protein [Sedimentimonas flavescens]